MAGAPSPAPASRITPLIRRPRFVRGLELGRPYTRVLPGRTPAHLLPDAYPQLLFTDLARVGGQTVDLRVVADTEYRA